MNLIDINQIPIELLIEAYKELKSSYKVAKKFQTSATAVKRLLKLNNILRNQSKAAKERINSNFNYKRTNLHKKRLSDLAKTRIQEKNPFYGHQHTEITKEKIGKASKERTGLRNPNYKNGAYQRRPRDYKIHEFTRLRNFIFNRDNYTCFYCQKMGGHLHAHHRIPYWVRPDSFLDPDNLLCVCTICHFEKAHLKSWIKFDLTLIDERLIKRYSLDRERLNELANNFKLLDAKVPTTNYK